MQMFDLFAIRGRHKTESTGNHDEAHEVNKGDTDRCRDTELYQNLAGSHDKRGKSGSRCQVTQERSVSDSLNHALQCLDFVTVSIVFCMEFVNHEYQIRYTDHD